MGERQRSIGIYRSGTQLESFMRMCGASLTIAGTSRLPALTQAIIGLQGRGEESVLKTIIERAADPRDFAAEPEKLAQVLEYLNDVLVLDGFELRQVGKAVRLMQAWTGAPVLTALANTLKRIDFDTVDRDLERALEAVASDPESAVDVGKLSGRERVPVDHYRAPIPRQCRRSWRSRTYIAWSASYWIYHLAGPIYRKSSQTTCGPFLVV